MNKDFTQIWDMQVQKWYKNEHMNYLLIQNNQILSQVKNVSLDDKLTLISSLELLTMLIGISKLLNNDNSDSISNIAHGSSC